LGRGRSRSRILRGEAKGAESEEENQRGLSQKGRYGVVGVCRGEVRGRSQMGRMKAGYIGYRNRFLGIDSSAP
jgi:hypothetical protein